MPSSSTVTPRARASVIILSRLSRVSASGRLRSPSLAPSSSIRMRGCCSSSACGSLPRPPAVVSPLSLPFITRNPYPNCETLRASKLTQPCSTWIPKPALRLSPNTRMAGDGWAVHAAGAASASSSANRKPMTRDIVLEARNLSKQVSSPEGPLTIVRNISFTVTRGESIALVGPSGAGKSTLLALLAGLDLPSSGEVVLAGEILGALDEDGRARLRAERVGFVFQSFHLLPSLTARENVMLPLELSGRDDARAAADDMLERV